MIPGKVFKIFEHLQYMLNFVSGKIMNGEGDSEQKVQGAPVTDQTLPNLVSYTIFS